MPACNRWWHHCPFIWKGGNGRKEQDYCEDNAKSCWSSCGYIHSYCSNSPKTKGGRAGRKGVGQETVFVAGTYEAITARRISVMYYDVGMAWWEGPEVLWQCRLDGVFYCRRGKLEKDTRYQRFPSLV
ncbi:hypothetical protein CEXT_124111 [Caerostris extrusa]|uniref:Uncharacterized protein n=1 Tax=Caerostris extrusa TaxID=172846 RepID=A0AAV4MJ37_CAEEX|nr:hypothetical protein CEXT_124111 [Caerostris extrusa]